MYLERTNRDRIRHGIIMASRAHKAGRGSLRHRIVVRSFDKGGMPWVVHTQIWDEVGNTSFEYGHYFSEKSEACKKFYAKEKEFETNYSAFLE